MKVIICLLVLTVAVCYAGTPNFIIKLISNVNKKKSTWKAGNNFADGTTIDKLQNLVNPLNEFPVNEKDLRRIQHDFEKNKLEIPKQFDARTCWKDCTTIARIDDQSSCRSGWAVSSATAISNRICIFSKGRLCPSLSAANLIACCKNCGKGCGGGNAVWAWKHWKEVGIPTGYEYNSTEGCQNYPFPPCNAVTSEPTAWCPYKLYDTPKCAHQCDACTSYKYNDTVNCGRSWYAVHPSERQIQADILDNGPNVATFKVYEDFFHYKSGVYQHCYGSCIGTHAVRIIGWGVEDGVKYWLCVNSFGKCWGDKGTFKILRGSNHCGIEELVVGGSPNV